MIPNLVTKLLCVYAFRVTTKEEAGRGVQVASNMALKRLLPLKQLALREVVDNRGQYDYWSYFICTFKARAMRGGELEARREREMRRRGKGKQ